MKGTCSKTDCGLKDGLGCDLGHPDWSTCPHFQETADGAAIAELGGLADDTSGQRLPWTGRALGLNDLSLASARAPAHLVGLVGPFNAGKTGFLTSIFAHLAKAGGIGSRLFAGSFTLEGWKRLKHYTVWPNARGPAFPPHTPDSAERVPSVLHLAFREEAKLIRDVLFTDAPGEWFTRWVKNQSADEAQGARWIAANASSFFFMVDREALAGRDGGKARYDTETLARLLSEHRRGRPIFAIWTKSDRPFDADAEKPVRQRLDTFFGDHQSFNVSVQTAAGLEVLGSLLDVRFETARTAVDPPTASSPFIAYGAATK